MFTSCSAAFSDQCCFTASLNDARSGYALTVITDTNRDAKYTTKSRGLESLRSLGELLRGVTIIYSIQHVVRYMTLFTLLLSSRIA